jgi:hypothetical protein
LSSNRRHNANIAAKISHCKQLTATSLTVSDEDDTMNAIPLATNDQSCA